MGVVWWYTNKRKGPTMAKVEKVRGLNIFLTDDEAAALSALLNYGTTWGTRNALGLGEFATDLSVNAPYTSFEFGQVADKDAPVKEDA